MRRLAVALFVSALFLAGCGGETIEAASDKPKSETKASGPDIQVEVAHVFFTEDPLGRFAFKFTNPADKTRVGVRATWKALDEDGVIVGTFDTALPPIGPGATWYYVGGAGGANLTGVPAQAKIEVTDKGELDGGEFTSAVTVEKAEFKRSEYEFTPGVHEYDVSAVLAATEDVESAEITSSVVLFDANGNVVGGNWLDFGSAPEIIASGEKVRAESTVYLTKAESKPVKVQVFVWAEAH